MGKSLSTQLKICNNTSGSISTSVSDTKPSRWVEPNTPNFNFHSAMILPNSEYSRELTINARRRAHCFTLTMTFNDAAKVLDIRLDQGQTVESARNRLPHKEKYVFQVTGDVVAYEVKHSVSGNTLTIDIRDSYMYNSEASIKKTSQVSGPDVVEEKKDPRILSVLRDLLIKEEEEKKRISELESEQMVVRSGGDVEDGADIEETELEINEKKEENLEEKEVSVEFKKEEDLPAGDEKLLQEIQHTEDETGVLQVNELLKEEEEIIQLLQQEQLEKILTHDIVEPVEKDKIQEHHIHDIEQQIQLLEQEIYIEKQHIQEIELKNEIIEQDAQLEEYIQQILKEEQHNFKEELGMNMEQHIQIKELQCIQEEEHLVEETHTKEVVKESSILIQSYEPKLQVEEIQTKEVAKESSPLIPSYEPKLQKLKESQAFHHEQQVSHEETQEDNQHEVQLRIKVFPSSPLLPLQESHF